MTLDNSCRGYGYATINGRSLLTRIDGPLPNGKTVGPLDSDVALFVHDAAGRPLARIDETGSVTRYSYDNAGRLLAVGRDKVANLLQYRYRGGERIGVTSTTDGDPAHATERLEYQYDAMGRLTMETRWLADVGLRDGVPGAASSKGLLFVTRYEYDAAGRLVQTTLPDGHRLRYRFTPADAGQPIAQARRPGQLEAILFDDDIVVGDIAQTIAGGLTGYTMSNGARQQITLDRRGRIEQLRTLPAGAAPDSGWRGRIAAWFSAGANINQALLYRQDNLYDGADRLLRIDRQLATAEGQPPAAARREDYTYDGMNRLTCIVSGAGARTDFRYDRAGNRVAESNAPRHAATPAARGFNYAPGRNWLLAATQANDDGAAAPSLRGAWFYHPTGLPLAQLQWQTNGGANNRRTVYNSDKRPVAVYDNDQLIARYHYNSMGERIAKTIYPARPALVPVASTRAAATGETVYTLYRDQRLAAETDSAGRISAHYIYLFGKPVAKIEMTPQTGVVHRLWKSITMRTADGASDSVARIYAIVTDHLGTPQQVLDELQRPVWQAVTAPFGQARIIHALAGANGKPFQMNLRLPGQVHDAETGLHYNYLRDYDPTLGRYLAPDPMGHAGGANPYTYVSNNPLTNIDPLGLYQIDVHYYMTFFLSITAGVDKDTARQIALATQYIDENPVTEPMLPDGLHPGSVLVNQPALERYHFVEDGYDPPRSLAENAYLFAFGRDMQSYIDRRVANPGSPQLARLLAASNFAKTDPNATCNSSAQLFGEYLHAYEDTFAHRNQQNSPYNAFIFGLGTGHLTGGENPDFTYNHFSTDILGFGAWDNNESRTLEMEKEVFAKLKTFSNPANHQETSVATIMYTLNTFNAMHADFSANNLEPKIAILNDALKYLGYQGIDMTYRTGTNAYVNAKAQKNRGETLNRLKPEDYIGTILPAGTAPLPVERK